MIFIKHKTTYSKYRLTPLQVYLRSVYYTILLCLIALIIFFYATQEPIKNVTENQSNVPINGEQTNSFVNTTIFIKSEYNQKLLNVILVRFNLSAKKVIITTLPSNTYCSSGQLSALYDQGGAELVIRKLNDEFSVTTHKFFDFSSDSIYKFTKVYGNISYKIPSDISYYNPQTANAFLATKGYNNFNGNEVAKLIEYYSQRDITQSNQACSELFETFFKVNLNPQKITKDNVVNVINSVQTNLTLFDYEQNKDNISAFINNKFETHIISTDGTLNNNNKTFYLSIKYLNQLKETYN